MANPLKVLTALSASSGVAVSGSDGLVIQQGGITVNNGNIVASSAQLSASSISGSSYIGNGSGLTSLTASQLSNFQTDVRGQFSNGTGVTITDGAVAIGQAVGTTSQVTFAGVTASFTGSGAGLTSLSASQLSNFSTDVRGQFSSGTGVTITDGSVAIGQAVGTTSQVTFAGVTGSFSGSGAGLTNVAASTATTLATARDISLGGDVTAVTQSFNGSSNIVFDVQLAAGVVGATELASGVAGAGLTGGNGSALAVGAGTHITVNADDVAVNTSTLVPAITASIFAGLSGDISVTNAGVVSIAANSVALGTDTTGDYVASVAATTNAGLTVSGTGEGATVTVGLKNADSLSTNKVLKWDETNNQLVNSSITDDGSKVELTTALTGTHAYFANNLTVVGTASFGQLNVINQQSLNIGDKYIVVASGSTGHENLEGAGMLWGSGAVGGTLFSDAAAHAAIVYRNSNDRLEIFPGLSSSYITGSELNIAGTAKFDGNVTLGNASSDTITVTGQMSASAGISGSSLVVGGASNFNGQVTASAGVSGSSLIVGGKSTLNGDVTGSGGIQAKQLYFSASANSEYTFNVGQGNVNVYDAGFNNVKTVIDNTLAYANNNAIGKSTYIGFRTQATASVYTGSGGDFVFLLSGDIQNSPWFSQTVGSNVVSAKRITGLYDVSDRDTLLARLSYLSFDVATKESGTTFWTNDLVSVKVEATSSNNSSNWYPKITVSAPALTANNAGNSKIRLVAVTEDADAVYGNYDGPGGGFNNISYIIVQDNTGSMEFRISSDGGSSTDETKTWANYFTLKGNDFQSPNFKIGGPFGFDYSLSGKHIQISSSHGQSGWISITSGDAIYLNFVSSSVVFPYV